MSIDDRRLASDRERHDGVLPTTNNHAHEDAPLPPPDPATPVDPATAEPVIPATRKAKSTSALREIVETVVLALIIFFAVRLVVLNFRVDGTSMMPNLQNSEMLLVNRNAYFHFNENALINWIPGVGHKGTHEVYIFHKPQRGDIIVFHPPVESNKPFIKRIIGLPGDHVTFQGGYVYINGQRLNEPYINGPITDCPPGRYCDVVVPQGQVFVMGDNRQNSDDSRYFGTVNISEIIGKAWVTYWPIHDIGGVPHYSYPNIGQ